MQTDVWAMEAHTAAITLHKEFATATNDCAGSKIAVIADTDLSTARSGIIHNRPYGSRSVEVELTTALIAHKGANIVAACSQVDCEITRSILAQIPRASRIGNFCEYDITFNSNLTVTR